MLSADSSAKFVCSWRKQRTARRELKLLKKPVYRVSVIAPALTNDLRKPEETG
jgi:hypothetical protein